MKQSDKISGLLTIIVLLPYFGLIMCVNISVEDRQQHYVCSSAKGQLQKGGLIQFSSFMGAIHVQHVIVRHHYSSATIVRHMAYGRASSNGQFSSWHYIECNYIIFYIVLLEAVNKVREC